MNPDNVKHKHAQPCLLSVTSDLDLLISGIFGLIGFTGNNETAPNDFSLFMSSGNE